MVNPCIHPDLWKPDGLPLEIFPQSQAPRHHWWATRRLPALCCPMPWLNSIRGCPWMGDLWFIYIYIDIGIIWDIYIYIYIGVILGWYWDYMGLYGIIWDYIGDGDELLNIYVGFHGHGGSPILDGLHLKIPSINGWWLVVGLFQETFIGEIHDISGYRFRYTWLSLWMGCQGTCNVRMLDSKNNECWTLLDSPKSIPSFSWCGKKNTLWLHVPSSTQGVCSWFAVRCIIWSFLQACCDPWPLSWPPPMHSLFPSPWIFVMPYVHSKMQCWAISPSSVPHGFNAWKLWGPPNKKKINLVVHDQFHPSNGGLLKIGLAPNKYNIYCPL